MIRNIIQIGNPALRQKSEPIDPAFMQTLQFRDLKKDLLDTLHAQGLSAAISAVQIGELHRVFVVEVKAIPNKPEIEPFGPTFFINPELISASPEEDTKMEGCLSIFDAQLFGEVKRPISVTLKYLDEEANERIETYADFIARILQHEIDHLNGILFTDRTDVKTMTTLNEYRKKNSKLKAQQKV